WKSRAPPAERWTSGLRCRPLGRVSRGALRGGGRAQREPQGERGAAAEGAVDRDHAAEEAGEPLADREAEAGAAGPARVHTGELLEDVLLRVERDSRAGVPDGDRRGGHGAELKRAGPGRDRDADAAPGRRVFDGVGE